MAELWDNILAGAGHIKDFVFGFYDIASFLFNLIPSPFKEILLVGLLVTVVIVGLKIVRG